MNEFELHWTINNFATYYNPKHLEKIQLIIFSLVLESTKNNTLRPLAQKGYAPLLQHIT